jgi:hypothetical protein
VVYQVRGRTIEVFYPEKIEDSLRDPTRICREVLYNSLPVGDWYCMHASAVAKDGKAIVFTGQGGAGKTTVVCHLLSSADHERLFDFVSNDQVWVNLASGRMNIIGWPLPIRIGYGTLSSIAELAPNLSLFRDYFHITNKHWTVKNHQYSAREFTDFFGCEISPEAEVVAIVRLKQGTSNLLFPVEDDAARVEVIKRAAGDNESTYPNWMRIGKAPNERELNNFNIENVTCPVYEMEFTTSELAVTKCDESIINALGNLLE